MARDARLVQRYSSYPGAKPAQLTDGGREGYRRLSWSLWDRPALPQGRERAVICRVSQKRHQDSEHGFPANQRAERGPENAEQTEIIYRCMPLGLKMASRIVNCLLALAVNGLVCWDARTLERRRTHQGWAMRMRPVCNFGQFDAILDCYWTCRKQPCANRGCAHARPFSRTLRGDAVCGHDMRRRRLLGTIRGFHL